MTVVLVELVFVVVLLLLLVVVVDVGLVVVVVVVVVLVLVGVELELLVVDDAVEALWQSLAASWRTVAAPWPRFWTSVVFTVEGRLATWLLNDRAAFAAAPHWPEATADEIAASWVFRLPA